MSVKRTLIFGDTHLEQEKTACDAYLLLKRVAKALKPNDIIALGDLMDFSYISSYTTTKGAEGKRLAFDVDLFRDELAFFNSCVKKGGTVTFLEGNHENRLMRFIEDTPVLDGLISLEEVCKELGVVYIATEEQPHEVLDGLMVCHGLSIADNFSSNLLKKLGGYSLIQGHTHRTQSYALSSYNDRFAQVVGIGSLCELNEDYVKGKRVTGHTNSFAILYTDEETGFWDISVVMIKNGRCIVEGKTYSLF